jgi:hypothetical protein
MVRIKREAAGTRETPTMWLRLKAPVELFERIDRWCEQQQEAQGMTMRPSRPAAIRWIVHNFLLKQEQTKSKSRRARRRRI